MNDLAAAAGPFAGAARLLEKLAGVRLTARRVERAAEASGTALAAAGRERARLIASRKVVPLPPSPLRRQRDRPTGRYVRGREKVPGCGQVWVLAAGQLKSLAYRRVS